MRIETALIPGAHLEEIGAELTGRLSSDHSLLSPPDRLPLWRARVLLGAAMLGDYRFNDLLELAVGVELLSQATEDHYAASASRLTAIRILSGDRRYATGLACICSAGRPELVEIVAEALVEVAQSQAERTREEERVAERRGLVLAAAARLGARSANVDQQAEELVAAMAKQAVKTGVSREPGDPATQLEAISRYDQGEYLLTVLRQIAKGIDWL